jgi:GntR family transcriptional regulator
LAYRPVLITLLDMTGVMSIGEKDPRAYVQIASRLRREITEGTFAPGSAAPSITMLAEQFGRSRLTCARALRILEAEGLVTRIPGLGYYVTAGTDD